RRSSDLKENQIREFGNRRLQTVATDHHRPARPPRRAPPVRMISTDHVNLLKLNLALSRLAAP
ncbi:MAG: hypothetical protein PHI71_13660, partial [Acidiphilium sp.]|nr:hypothetical protein [Acidiphilium sp.]